jgi:hypothetical protein
MTANFNPIYSIQGMILGGQILTTGANTYTGQGVTDNVICVANSTNGSYVQRLRFKALGSTTSATVARIYINNGDSQYLGQVAAPAGTPTGTPSASGGTLASGTYFAKIVSVDQYGGRSVASTETASVSVTGPTGSIAWAWTAATGASSYRIYVGPLTGQQLTYFTSSTNAYTQTAPIGVAEINASAGDISNNNEFIGELSLPIVTGTATAATIDIDYPLNFALSPGYRIIVGLATTVTAGWVVTCIGGDY